MKFRYRARDWNGEPLEGEIEAEDQKRALESLRREGLVAVALNAKPSRKGLSSLWSRLQHIGTVPVKSEMVFFRQMAAMAKAGLGLPASLEIIAEQEENPIFKDTLLQLRDDVNRGVPLSQAMKFGPLIKAIVRAGEEGGVMDDALERVAVLLENQEALKSKVRGALLYPVFVAVFALVVLAVFLTLILPQFKQVFDAMHIELPRLTLWMYEAGAYCLDNKKRVALVAAGIVLVPLLLGRLPLMDRLKLKIPLFGKLILHASLARASRTLASLVDVGVPLLQSLEAAAGTAGNAVVKKGFLLLRDGARQGVSLGDAAKRSKIFPTLVSQMMRIGEETGRLDNMMDRVALWYEQELDAQLKTMTTLLGPIAIILVGGVVALIALSIFRPIMSAMSQIR